jgi:hypothetical protein
MPLPAYIELKQLVDDTVRLSILKSKYNRAATKLNGFYKLLSEEQIAQTVILIKYLQQEIDRYEQ